MSPEPPPPLPPANPYNQWTAQCSPFPNLCVLCVLCANPFRPGKSTRAKLAKDAKVKGINPDEIAKARQSTCPLTRRPLTRPPLPIRGNSYPFVVKIPLFNPQNPPNPPTQTPRAQAPSLDLSLQTHPGGIPAISRGLSEATPPDIPSNRPRPRQGRSLVRNKHDKIPVPQFPFLPLTFASFAPFARFSSPAPKRVRAKDAKLAKGFRLILPPWHS